MLKHCWPEIISFTLVNIVNKGKSSLWTPNVSYRTTLEEASFKGQANY